MPQAVIEMEGMVFGMLTVGKRIGMRHGQSEYRVSCQCGKEKTMLRVNILKSHSCGCVPRAQFYKHGMSETKLFGVWTNMNRRCYDAKAKDYPRYGGRGITVCQEWRDSFSSFYDWAVKAGYRQGLSIDRMDNFGGYSPANCRWATAHEQAINKRSNIWIEYQGIRLTISQWAKRVGINRTTLEGRYHRNWPVEKMLTKGVQ